MHKSSHLKKERGGGCRGVTVGGDLNIWVSFPPTPLQINRRAFEIAKVFETWGKVNRPEGSVSAFKTSKKLIM